MQILYGALGLLCAGGGAGLAMSKYPPEPEKKKHMWFLLSVIAGVGLLCGLILFHRVEDWSALGRMLLCLAVLAAAAYTDVRDTSIPNACVLTLLAGFAILSALEWIIRPETALVLFLGGLVGLAGMFLLLLICRLVARGGIGYGDVKLMAGLGAVLGLYGAFNVLLFGHVLAVLCAVVLLLMKKVTIKDGLPFAPFFYLGYAVTLFLGHF